MTEFATLSFKTVPAGTNHALRFFVQDAEGKISATWRLWTSAEDAAEQHVFLGERRTVGQYKVSLHESGDWRIQMTAGHAKKTNQSRAMLLQWERPLEMAPGWTEGPMILFPANELRPPTAETHKDAVSIPATPERSAVIARVMLETPDSSTIEYTDARPVGRVKRRPDLGSVLVLAQAVSLSSENYTEIHRLRAEAAVALMDDLKRMPEPGERTVGVFEPADGGQVLVDLSLV